MNADQNHLIEISKTQQRSSKTFIGIRINIKTIRVLRVHPRPIKGM
jgi:hypothetical protein